MKKTIATLSAGLIFVAIITLPLLNTAAASANTSTPVTHRSYTAQQETTTLTAMALALYTNTGKLNGASLIVKANEKFGIFGTIGSYKTGKNANPTGGLKVNIFGSRNKQKWANLGTFTSETGQNDGLPEGGFGNYFTAPSSPGVYYFIANFPGDNQYARQHSNTVTLMVIPHLPFLLR